MRRYDDPVETRMGQVSGMEGPEQFLWRGRLWKVRAVLAHWVETGPWWQSGGVRAVIGSDQPVAAQESPDLRSADLRSADLRSADLRSADLRSADLRSADLRGADLRSADLRSADLRGADLLGERELWRVEAGRGPAGDGADDCANDCANDWAGVFELSFDWSDGRWALVGCAD
jgi:hypothetical protein